MESGKLYKIVYKTSSEDRERAKDLIFLRQENSLLIFFNPLRKLEEAISEQAIIRWEEVKE